MLKTELLTTQQIERIIEASMTILEDTGVHIHSNKARELLINAGCAAEGALVKIPRNLIKKALETAPSNIQIYNRNGYFAMDLGGKNTYYGSGPTCPNFFDPKTGEHRKAIKQDAADTAKVADALTNINFVMSLCTVGDQTAELSDLHEVHAMLQNTTKPFGSWSFNEKNLSEIVDMCACVAGSEEALQEKPFVIIYTEPTTPLVHTKEALEKMMFLAEKKIPVIYSPGMVLGGTTPVTICAALSVGVADSLTGLLISQLIRPGAPVITSAAGCPMDMKTMQCSYGGPEMALLYMGSTEIYNYLNLPTFGLAGATDAKVVDAQAASEATFQLMLAKGSGANLVHDVGFMDFGMSGSIEYMVLCDEIISMTERFFRGIEVDDERLDTEMVNRVGPGGNFLVEEHTMKYFREELWSGNLCDRNSYSIWESNGSKTMTQKANEKMKNILDTYTPEPLTGEIKENIDSILAAAEQRIKNQTINN